MAKVLFVILVPNDPVDKKLKEVELIEKKGVEDDNKNVSTEKSAFLEDTADKQRDVLSGWNFDVDHDKNNSENAITDKVSTTDEVSKDVEENGSILKVAEPEINHQEKNQIKKSSSGLLLESNRVENGSKADEQQEPQRKKSNAGLAETDIPEGGGRKRKKSIIALFSHSDSCTSMSDKLAQGTDGKNRKNSTAGMFTDIVNVLEKVKNTLADMNICGVQWSTTSDSMEMGVFLADDGETCETLLKRLTILKISINVFPASISIASVQQKEETEKLKQILEQEDKLAERVSEFKKSIKSRLVVAQVVDAVKSDAVFTFDFLMLVMLASMVAVMGLLEASSVALVASMLISPLMGPIIAGVFGTVIGNNDLLLVGFRSEMKGLCLCILIGFTTGFLPAILETTGCQWRATDSWPTIEMSARGSLRSLLIGVLIAIPSGAGVALSILGGKVGSLVGVAISASLLPPAVNAGLLWANAIVVSIKPLPTRLSVLVNDTMNPSLQAEGRGPLQCPEYMNNEFTHEYFCDMAKESAVLGVVSLLLTILNIICIIIMGIVVLKIKEVAPISSVPSAEHEFFVEDIKIARENYQTARGKDSLLLGKRFLQEYRNVKNNLGVEDDSDEDENELHKIVEEVEESADVKEIIDQMPHKPKRWSAYMNDDKHDVDKVYKTVQLMNFSPNNVEEGIQLRRRRNASGENRTTSWDASLLDTNTYFTIHRLPSPRASGKFHFPRTGRFKVDKVVEMTPDKQQKYSVTPVHLPPAPKITLENQPLLQTE